MSYSSDVLALSPDAYYRLADLSATTMADSSGNARDGSYTDTGSITYGATGIPGAGGNKAATFAGVSGNFGSVADAAWMDRTANMGVGIWFKTTNTGNNYMIQRWGSTSATQMFGLDLQSSNVIRGYYRVTSNRILSATVTGLRDGNWHFAFINYDGSNVRLYVDGVEVGTAIAATGSIQTGAADVRIAQRTGVTTDLMTGSLDEVYIGPSLTAPQIAALYTSGSTAGTLGGTIGVTTETDAAQTLGRRKSKTLGIAAATNDAQPIARTKRKAVGTALETDAAVHINRAGVFGVATETDTAQPIGVRKVRALGTATETDASQALAHIKYRALGIATETDASQHIVATMPIIRALGTALETDAAQTIVPDYYIGPVDGDLSSAGGTNITGWADVDYDVPDPDDPPGVVRSPQPRIHISA